MAGVYLGYRDRAEEAVAPSIPDEATIYAGGIAGRFEIQESGFGDFDNGFGFGGGIEFTWNLTPTFSYSLIGEYRMIKFDYEEDVLTGDTFAGGSSGWVGMGAELRF